MKNTFKIIYIIFIFAILCIPVGFMKFYKSENTENRKLAQRPSVLSENFEKEFESYISDNFAFRDILVNADSSLKANIFGLSGNEKVTVGKYGWLFYTESLEDVTSKNTMTDREIYCTVRTLEIINDYVKSNGGKFVFTIAPNKASLYDKYLPYYYSKSNIPNNANKITESLKNVDYIDLKVLFEEQKEILYHRLDSHWNNKGALLVTNTLLEHLNLEKSFYSEPVKRQDWEGDLYKMIFPTMSEKDIQYYYNKNEFHYSHTRRFKSTDDMIISTENKMSKNGSILLLRDSFGRSMFPFVAESFSKATLVRTLPYDLNQIENNKYDYVVFEICERNLKNIILKAPYMKAPKADVNINTITKLNNNDFEIVMETGKLNHIYGRILTDIPENTRIYATIGDELYEAFPCCEFDASEEPKRNNNGFSLYTDNNDSKVNIYISIIN